MQVGLTLEGRIEELVSPSLNGLGYEIVRIKMIGTDRHKILQVMIERTDGAQIKVDDCEKASRQMSAVLDVEDAITEQYNLEVSSPGIDRPLTRLKDFETYKGLEAKIELFDKVDEQRKFRGRLLGVEGDTVKVDLNVVPIKASAEGENKIEVKFENIKSAKLVLTDELMEMYSKKTGAAE